MNTIVPLAGAGLSNEANQPAAASRVRDYAASAFAARTRKAYAGDWQRFESWCRARRFTAMPAAPGALAAYLSHLADSGRKVSTIGRALASISMAHQMASKRNPGEDPHVKQVWKGIRNQLGVAKVQKRPLSMDQLAMGFEAIPDTLTGARDRAMLSLCFALGCRITELVALNVADVETADEGLVICIRESKRDQEKAGRYVGICLGRRQSTCPVRLLRHWLHQAKITSGPLFRKVSRSGKVGLKPLSKEVVWMKVKTVATSIGVDPKDFGGHSLRSGFVTTAYKKGKKLADIMRQTGHAEVQTLMTYVRKISVFEDNATKGLY